MITFGVLQPLELTGGAAAGGVIVFWMNKWAATAWYAVGDSTPHLLVTEWQWLLHRFSAEVMLQS